MVDVVVTWVDGRDPRHQNAKNKAALQLGLSKNSEALSPARFYQYEELRYCLRSIYNHAPWVDNVYLVTDNQAPDFIDFEIADQCGIKIVSHSSIFKEHEHYLPTYNSCSIETMLFRIDGLSDKFIYLNDDVFFAKKVLPEDFFSGDTPLIRGKWKTISADEDVFSGGLISAAKFIDADAVKYFKPEHSALPMTVSHFQEIVDLSKGSFFENAQYPFRDSRQFQPASLLYYYLSEYKKAETMDAERLFTFNIRTRRMRSEKMKTYINSLFFRNGYYTTACLNDFDKQAKNFPGLIHWVEKATGPKAPFEL